MDRPSIAGYVLAGGASSRFGSDKALASFGDETMLSRMCRLLEEVTGSVQVVASAQRYPNHSAKVIEDRWPGEGPLGGIITALDAQKRDGAREWSLIVSCDMPFLTPEWLYYMTTPVIPTITTSVIPSEARNLSDPPFEVARDAEVIVPQSTHGLEPLCACWRTSAVDKLQGAFDQGVRKVTEAMKRLRMEVLDETHWKRFDSAGRLFWNMNTQQDYEEALSIWKSENA